MSMNIVKSKRSLKRRIEGFFASERDERQAANTLIEALSRDARVYIFGGMIRDLGLYGRSGFHSDIDLVYLGSRHDLYNALTKLNVSCVSENKFGGYRLTHSRMDFDIWSVEDTWAFREDVISFESVDSLLNTTLMTWDAVIYDIKLRKIIAQPYYLQDLINGRLDLVLDKNPNQKGSLVKIIRTIYGKNVITLGDKLCKFLNGNLKYYSSKELMEYEFLHFNNNILSANRIERLMTALKSWQAGKDIVFNYHLKQKQLKSKY